MSCLVVQTTHNYMHEICMDTCEDNLHVDTGGTNIPNVS